MSSLWGFLTGACGILWSPFLLNVFEEVFEEAFVVFLVFS